MRTGTRIGLAALLVAAVASAPQIDRAESNAGAACTETGFSIILTNFTGTHQITWSVNGGPSGSVSVTGSKTVFVDTPNRAPNSTVNGVASWPRWVQRGGRWVTNGVVTEAFTTKTRCVNTNPPTVSSVAPAPPAGPPAVEIVPAFPTAPAKPPVKRATAKKRVRKSSSISPALRCRSWARRPANGVGYQRSPKPGQVRVKRVGKRWYGFRDRWVVTTTVVLRGNKVVSRKRTYRIKPGGLCAAVKLPLAG